MLQKRKILHVGRKNPKYEYFMIGVKIDEDLGYGLTCQVNRLPSKQVSVAAKAGNFVLGQFPFKMFHQAED